MSEKLHAVQNAGSKSLKNLLISDSGKSAKYFQYGQDLHSWFGSATGNIFQFYLLVLLVCVIVIVKICAEKHQFIDR
jgi:hypothetical protein